MNLPPESDIKMNIEIDDHRRFLCITFMDVTHKVRVPLHDYYKIEAGNEKLAQGYIMQAMKKFRLKKVNKPKILESSSEPQRTS